MRDNYGHFFANREHERISTTRSWSCIFIIASSIIYWTNIQINFWKNEKDDTENKNGTSLYWIKSKTQIP